MADRTEGFHEDGEGWGIDGNPLLVKPRAAARSLGISARKLWSLTASGEIPHVRIGRSVRYPLAELREWIELRTQGGN